MLPSTSYPTPLTSAKVRSLQQSNIPYIVWDSKVSGLGVKVAPSGRKTFILYYRSSSGTQRKPTIGKWDEISLSAARRIANDWKLKIANGIDVSRDRQLARSSENIFRLCDRYIDEYAKIHKKPSSVQSDISLIRNYIKPRLGSIPVADLTRQDIIELRDWVAKKRRKEVQKGDRSRGRRVVVGGKGAANRTIACVSKMLNCSIDWGYREFNPALGIRKFPENRKDRFLDSEEIQRLHETFSHFRQSAELSSVAIDAIEILLLTGARAGEIQSLKRSDIALDRSIIRLQDSKTGKKTIALCETAKLLLEERLNATSGNGYIFPGRLAGSRIELRRPWHSIRQHAKLGDDVTLHTLRHTYASWAVMGGLSLAQVGELLGHRSTQTTLRYADHLTNHLVDYSNQVAKLIAKEAIGAETNSNATTEDNIPTRHKTTDRARRVSIPG